MGDVPGLGLSFPPFAAPRWFCPESDDDDEEQQQCFIPAYGRPPFGLYGPYGDPLLAPPRGFTDADSDTRGLSAAWGHRVTAEVSARPALPAPGRPTAAFGPSAPTRRSRGPGSALPVRPEPPPCFCPPAEPRRDPSRVRGSRRRPHHHPGTAAVCVSQPSPALQRGPGAHSRSAAPLVPQEAEKNAMELLAEEERMKRKAEKKKLKKKKQKDRRKQERLEQELRSKQAAASGTTSLPGAVGAAHGDASGAEEESGCLASSPPPCLQGHAEEGVGDLEGIEDELDLSCTFVFKAWQKAGVKLPAPARDKSVRADAAEPNKRLQEGASKPEPALMDTNMLEQSWILAGCGNQAAMQGRYKEAVQAFTEAIKLNPREHRLFGNRSYCYEKLQQYQEALRDAQMALELQPNWPKGFFRKGKALWGLKRYAEARDTFKNLEGAHTDVAAQLEACQMLLQQSNLHDASSPRDVPVLEGGEPLTPTSADGCVNGSCSDVDMSGFVTVVNSRSHSKSTCGPPPQQAPNTHCLHSTLPGTAILCGSGTSPSRSPRKCCRAASAGSDRSNPSGCSRRSTAPSSTSSRRQRQKRRTEPCWALTWRAAGWRCSSSTHPTPHRRPDSARRTLRGGLEPSSSRWALPRELLDPQRSPECCRSSGLHGRLWSHVPAAASRAFSPQQQAWPHLPHCSYLVPLPRLCPGCAALGPTGQCGGVGTHRDSPSFRDVRLLWVS
ncbi:tetratricopeptide repeat protein 31 isoform X21 [Gallus gallus]|uniref:tetratricopeptide repeat protein 31 isoform X21 n=1 Tax=Gallus gallus TaxID=9031 RepID=UPI001F032C58|nr:tetratricopeptide repeat protein 31 isoform X21 [Gallus gallus]